MEKQHIHIGTSGWSYKEWKNIFYPPELKSTDWLSFYSKTFHITEINASFYNLPKKQTVESWVQKTPDDFLFCPKMSRYLTHIKKLKEPEEPLERFFSVFEPMQHKMGPVLIQLPPSLGFDLDTATYLYELLKKNYAGHRFAMEGRHKTWLLEESLALLSKYNIAFVVSQSGHGFPYGEHITAKDIYIRFHGPGKLYASSYDDATLKQFSILFKKWWEQGHDLWIFFNNTMYKGGIENALTLERLMKHK